MKPGSCSKHLSKFCFVDVATARREEHLKNTPTILQAPRLPEVDPLQMIEHTAQTSRKIHCAKCHNASSGSSVGTQAVCSLQECATHHCLAIQRLKGGQVQESTSLWLPLYRHNHNIYPNDPLWSCDVCFHPVHRRCW
jgi:hypothetical protein